MTERQLTVRPLGPWFRQRPQAALTVAAGLFGVIGAASLTSVRDRNLLAVALVLPVSLLAVSFGRRGGIGAGATAVSLYALWSTHPGLPGLGAAGWTGAASLVLVGVLLGEAVEDLAASEQRRQQAEDTARRHREATEINDMIVQGVAVAKWALEAGAAERALEILDQTVGEGQRLVSALLNDQPDRRRAPPSLWPAAAGDRPASAPAD